MSSRKTLCISSVSLESFTFAVLFVTSFIRTEIFISCQSNSGATLSNTTAPPGGRCLCAETSLFCCLLELEQLNNSDPVLPADFFDWAKTGQWNYSDVELVFPPTLLEMNVSGVNTSMASLLSLIIQQANVGNESTMWNQTSAIIQEDIQLLPVYPAVAENVSGTNVSQSESESYVVPQIFYFGTFEARIRAAFGIVAWLMNSSISVSTVAPPITTRLPNVHPTVSPETTIPVEAMLAASSRSTLLDRQPAGHQTLRARQSFLGCSSDTCPRTRGQFSSQEGCGYFLNCWDSCGWTQKCPGNLVFDVSKQWCEWPWRLPAGDPCFAPWPGRVVRPDNVPTLTPPVQPATSTTTPLTDIAKNETTNLGTIEENGAQESNTTSTITNTTSDVIGPTDWPSTSTGNGNSSDQAMDNGRTARGSRLMYGEELE